ncbi:MAG: protein kinase domain-containing protein [Nitriliruptoraceae bacterium]
MPQERDVLHQLLPSYELGQELGRGAWGVVFAATHRSLGRRVAVKYLPAAFSADPAARERFLAEARVVASLDHPHIVPLYDYVEGGNTCVFVMENMPGGTLWDRFSAEGLSPEAACSVGIALLVALDHAHRRDVLHRDVKPENVLFNAEGLPKLADFGIAKVLGDGAGTRTATGVILGTPAYMAPEQGSGEPLTGATDLYAVGAMLYELFAGRLPFESTGNPLTQLYRHVNEAPVPLREQAPAVHPALAEVVMQALAKAPGDRPADAASFARSLNAAATTAFGPDWPTRSGVPVLAARSVLGHTLRQDASSGPGSAPAAPRTPAGPPDADTPTASETTPPPVVAPPPSTAPPPASTPPPAAVAPPSSTTPPPAGAPSAPAAPSTVEPPAARPRGKGRLVAAVGAVVAVVAIVGAVLAFSDDDPPADGDATIPAAAIDRFEATCEANGVAPELCACALDRSTRELTVEEFLANDELLRTTGDQLTAEVRARFEACTAQVEG